MKNLKILLGNMAAGLCCCIIIFFSGCGKDKGFYEAAVDEKNVPLNTYDYLKSKRGIYDSLLLVIDRVGLADTLKKNPVTLFALSNSSFKLAMTNLNNLRRTTGKDPLFLSNVDIKHLDTLMTKYVIRGLYPTELLTEQDGLTFYGVKYNRMMHGKLESSTASGYNGGGPAYIKFDDTKQSIFVKNWVNTTTGSVNIKTTNGIVHIVEPNHVFGFDEFVKRITFIPKVRTPFYGVPFAIPGKFKAIDFDLGGEGVAYSDATLANQGGGYRPFESVDIEGYGDTFAIREGLTGEWLAYSVDVAETGAYELSMLLSTPVSNKTVSAEMDDVNITGGRVEVPNTNGYQNFTPVKRTVQLTKGKHVFKFKITNGPMNFYEFIFTKLP
ncbi:carbohydrate-binding protein [Pedobacter foliorum]|uniref:carbohydrate-binding protein n=1 Tax=Pedobacter foliorum TaxID=2739058 RepID=UPI0015639435|nr:carbohydrate-binding protein [Pedobacter foliorum]NRF41711.1 carbohydrate-binding protein [Pedobacter foliorum]